jgi:dTMP kinase
MNAGGLVFMPQKGCLIVFEGIEGSGKSTASRNLHKFLTSTKQFKAIWTREPTTYKIGAFIEEILTGRITVAEVALPLLFAADRADHTKRIISPSIRKGYIVISDRYIHSSLAYQKSGMGKVFRKEWLKEINRYAIEPDLVIFLDISPEEGLSRIGKWRRIHDDKFFEDVETQKRIRNAYHEILQLNKPLIGPSKGDLFSNSSLGKVKAINQLDNTTVVALDGSLNQEEIQNAVNDIVYKFVKSRGIEPEKTLSTAYSDLSGSFEIKASNEQKRNEVKSD